MEDAVDVYAGLTAIVALEGQIPVKYRGVCHMQEHTSVAFEASAATIVVESMELTVKFQTGIRRFISSATVLYRVSAYSQVIMVHFLLHMTSTSRDSVVRLS